MREALFGESNCHSHLEILSADVQAFEEKCMSKLLLAGHFSCAELLQEVKADDMEKLNGKLAEQGEKIVAVRNHVSRLITQQLTKQEQFGMEVSEMLTTQRERIDKQQEDQGWRLNALEAKGRLHG